MQVIDPHLLGPLWRFNEDFTGLDERGRVTGYRSLGELRRRLGSVMLRRCKEDVLTQLPARVVNRVVLPMTAEQQAVHDDAESQVARLLARLKKRPLTPQEEKLLLRAFQRMRMSCNAAALVGGKSKEAPKLEELAALLDEICVQGGRKVVVFSEWSGCRRSRRMSARSSARTRPPARQRAVRSARQAHRSLSGRSQPQGLPVDGRGRRRHQPAGGQPPDQL